MKQHRAALNAYADEVITRAGSAHAGDDVLGALLAARPGGKQLTPDELRGHVLGLFLAGNETTAAALSWAVVHGAQHPDEWAALRRDPEHRTLAFATESLRLNPAVWGIPRTPNRAGASLTAAGTTTRVRRTQLATIYLRGLNRDPKTWTDPLRFDPSRHDGNEKDSRPRPHPVRTRSARLHRSTPCARGDRGGAPRASPRRGDVVIDEPVTEDAGFALRIHGGLRGRFTAPRAT